MTKKLFINVAKAASIGSGSQSIQTINISNESDFQVTDIRTSGIAGVFISVANSTGELLSNLSFNSGLIGSGLNGYRLPEVFVIAKNSSLQVTFDNQSGGVVTNQELQLIGFKL